MHMKALICAGKLTVVRTLDVHRLTTAVLEQIRQGRLQFRKQEFYDDNTQIRLLDLLMALECKIIILQVSMERHQFCQILQVIPLNNMVLCPKLQFEPSHDYDRARGLSLGQVATAIVVLVGTMKRAVRARAEVTVS
jgi:hypothetical protein